MKNNFSIPFFISFSISIFLLWILGTWQLNKNYIQNKNNNKFAKNNSINFLKIANLERDIKDLTYVKLSGIDFTNKHLFLEPRTLKGKVGFHKIIVVIFKNKYLLVNQGFTLIKNKINYKNMNNNNIEGYIIKIPKPKFFELENDVKNKIWYTLKKTDFEQEFNVKLSPYILYQQNVTNNKIKPVLPNIVSKINHLNYALTWYFLSLSLCVIFFIYFKKNYE
jgi:cytochrome oxidase assembly protein ShyY1